MKKWLPLWITVALLALFAAEPVWSQAIRATLVSISQTATDNDVDATVTDGSGPLTVDGTVTANLGATDNAVLDDIADGIPVTNAGTFAVQAAQSGTWTVQPGNTANTTAWLFKLDGTGANNNVDVDSLPSVTIGTFPDNEPINVAQMNGVAVTMGNGAAGTGVQRVTLANDSTGVVGLNAGSNLIGQIAPVATATTTNAASGCYIVSAASTNSNNCKGSAGNFYGVRIINTTSTIYYLRLYNSSSAPTCSSATGFIESIPIPHATAAGAGMVAVTEIPIGYSTGISYCLTGGSSSTDNTNAATGLFGAIYYK